MSPLYKCGREINYFYIGLETRCFYSAQKDEVYVKIRAKPSRLELEAVISFKML